MNKIVDFKCTYDNSTVISKEVIERTGLKFPKAYTEADGMVVLSKELKKQNEVNFCQLPFCHTVEGEALGGIVNLGDENIGPRAKDYICSSIEEVLNLPNIDYSKGRIGEVLKACKKLKEEGENVVIYISGPFTIMNVLIDPIHIFKTFRKKPKTMQRVFDKFQSEILRFIKEAEKVGVNMISYADSSGGINILGPKFSEQTVEMFTYPLLKNIEKMTNEKTLVLLCPKTSLALIGTNKAKWEDININESTKYFDACLKVISKAKFVGQMCIKNKDFKLTNKKVKSIKLL